MKVSSTKIVFLLFGATVLFCGCSNENKPLGAPENPQVIDETEEPAIEELAEEEESLPPIVELAQSLDSLSTLLEVLEIADPAAINALWGENLTLFAPTNAAFDDFFESLEASGSLENFDEDFEKELLSEIVKYHIIEGAATFSDQLSNGTVLETLQSEGLSIDLEGGVFLLDMLQEKAELVTADYEAFNGVVHLIDRVLLPQAVWNRLFAKPSLTEVVAETEELTAFREALAKSGMKDFLDREGLTTVFAPTDEAIAQLFVILGDEYSSFDDFNSIIELQILREILLGHFIEGQIHSENMEPGILKTLLPQDSIELIVEGDTFVISDASPINANFISFDLEASNGTVHIIDKILIPQKALLFVN